MKKLKYIIFLLPHLGYRNVLYMIWYRFSLKTGIRKSRFLLGQPIKGEFFGEAQPVLDYPEEWKPALKERLDNLLKGSLRWFHYHTFNVGNPPNWFLNPFDGSVLKNPDKHWTELGDFDLNTGDVKILWEPSRFDWLTDLARGYRVFGERKYLEAMNRWLEDWSAHNPVNRGPNWKCGQETAIRVMKLISVSQIMSQNEEPEDSLQQMVYEHLKRINGNIRYSVAQDNNHGTSESAALYIGAVWLLNRADNYDKKVLEKWKSRGRSILQERILKLISEQGTFSQRSVTYHRVVVDTMSWVLYAMEQLGEPAFPGKVNKRLENLGLWQFKMISSDSGDTPNLGPNDGAMFETFHCGNYRDFRPSTQLFFGVLKKVKVFKDGLYDEPLFWRYGSGYRTFKYTEINIPQAEILDRQFLIITHQDLKMFLKIPVNRFRPSASDAFHLDLWYKNRNILTDSGSYSYNAGEETKWFKSIEAHNTVQFGGRQQMPVVGRFLFAKWVQGKTLSLQDGKDSVKWSGLYKDGWGMLHQREIYYDKAGRNIIVTDLFPNKRSGEPVILYLNSKYDISETIQVSEATGNIIVPVKKETGFSLFYLKKETKSTYAYKTMQNHIITKINLTNENSAYSPVL